jgi:hypothetical protein
VNGSTRGTAKLYKHLPWHIQSDVTNKVTIYTWKALIARTTRSRVLPINPTLASSLIEHWRLLQTPFFLRKRKSEFFAIFIHIRPFCPFILAERMNLEFAFSFP